MNQTEGEAIAQLGYVDYMTSLHFNEETNQFELPEEMRKHLAKRLSDIEIVIGFISDRDDEHGIMKIWGTLANILDVEATV